MIKAVLFDMDGVLVDSEDYIREAAMAMFREKGIVTSPEDFKPFVGTGENRYLGGVAEKHGYRINLEEDKKRTYDIYTEMVSGKLKALPGVHEFIKSCKARGLRIAVATSADRIKMEINLREIGIKAEEFDATVNGLEVENKKPDPEIFLKAAEKIGVKASDCLVVEDAINGVQAAKDAGAKCLALQTSFKAEELQEADYISNTLADANLEEILEERIENA